MFQWRIEGAGRGYEIINQYGKVVATATSQETADTLCSLLNHHLSVETHISDLASQKFLVTRVIDDVRC